MSEANSSTDQTALCCVSPLVLHRIICALTLPVGRGVSHELWRTGLLPSFPPSNVTVNGAMVRVVFPSANQRTNSYYAKRGNLHKIAGDLVDIGGRDAEFRNRDTSVASAVFKASVFSTQTDYPNHEPDSAYGGSCPKRPPRRLTNPSTLGTVIPSLPCS